MTITGKDTAVFRAIADTLLPPVEGPGPAWTTPGGELGLESRLSTIYERLPHDQARKDLKLFLGLLRTRAGGLLLFGRPKSFTAMSREDRSSAFLRMAGHPLSLIRGGAKALKTLVGLLWVSTEDPEDRPIAWEAMGYPGADGPPPDVPKPIVTFDVESDMTLNCDVVVVGSGAGGGTAAGVLSAAGLDVIVLESAAYHNESDFTHLEADAYNRMYLDRALNTTADGGMVVLSGATLGGGTVINYTTAFGPPVSLKREWDEIAGFGEVFTSHEFVDSVNAVEDRLSVSKDHNWPSSRDQLMEKGLRELGWHVHDMPRNVDGCTQVDCGYCTMGCRIGAKRSTLVTYLQDAFEAGARIVTGAWVDRVVTADGVATGVVARVGSSTLIVNARSVVLGAGALNSPAILLRSGVGGPATGDYLRLHPVTAVWARFEEKVEPWSGLLQTRYSDEFADLDGNGYGFKFETAPIHPLFPAAFLGWEDGAAYKRDVLGLGHVNVGGVLLRDRDHGKVTIRKDGSPVWKYSISRYDQAHVREGVRRGVEMYAAAGATEVIASTVRPVRWRPGDSMDAFMDQVDSIGYGSNQSTYFTFHQMGTARMGSDPAKSVVDMNNQVHGMRGLYVMDGSCFPSSSGVNPMLTIAAIAHRGATRLAENLS